MRPAFFFFFLSKRDEKGEGESGVESNGLSFYGLKGKTLKDAFAKSCSVCISYLSNLPAQGQNTGTGGRTLQSGAFPHTATPVL